MDFEVNNLTDLSGFCLESVIKEDLQKKSVNLLGHFEGREGQAIVVLSQNPWDISKLADTLKALPLAEGTPNEQYMRYSSVIENTLSVSRADLRLTA
jgi:hypothetical protein